MVKADRVPSEDTTSSSLINRRLGVDSSIGPTSAHAGI